MIYSLVSFCRGQIKVWFDDLIFLASKGIKQTKSEIKHSSESVSSTEEDGKPKPSDRVHDVLNVKCNKYITYYF